MAAIVAAIAIAPACRGARGLPGARAGGPEGTAVLGLPTEPSFRLDAPVRFLDRVRDGRVGQGDELVLAFTMEVLIEPGEPRGVELPVEGDSLGAGALWRAGPRPQEVTIVLGRDARLRVQQHYDASDAARGAPSAIALVPSSDGVPAVRSARSSAPLAEQGAADVLPDFVASDRRLGAGAVAVAIGDVDRDGAPDIVAAFRDQPLCVYYGGADQSFEDGVVLPAGRDVSDVELADLDRDGDLDIVATSRGAAALVWRNSGGGVLERAVRIGGAPARALAIGDVDGDGCLDLVLGSDGAERVWLGRGECQFTSGPTFGATPTAALALGDLDGDGDLDLVDIAGAGGDRSAHVVWMNAGDARFSARQRLGGSLAGGVRLADLDRDGDLDLVLGDAQASRVLLNDGRGRLLPGPPLEATSAWAPAVGDLDGDGIADLVQSRAHETTWLRGLGDGRFEPVGSSLDAVGVRECELADLDGDGDLDLCLATDDGVYVASGSRATSRDIRFRPETLAGGAALGRDLVVADLDGDGWSDIVTAGPQGLTFLRSERGRFATPLALGADGVPIGGAASVAVADFDGDLALDLVTGGLGGARVWLGDGDPLRFRAGPELSGQLATALEARDFDGDGRPDLVMGTDADAMARVWIARADGFEAPVATEATASRFGAASRLVAADFDGDGLCDLAVGSRVAAPTVVWRSAGGGRLEAVAELDAGATLGLDAADVDRDGDLDLLTADARGGARCAQIWLQDDEGAFAAGPSFGEGAASAATFADLDGDGTLEVLLGFHDRPCEVWRARGVEYERVETFGDAPAHALIATDLDRDGDVDVLQGAGQGGPVRVWWSH